MQSSRARCRLCMKSFKLGTMGKKALESHMASEKYKSIISRNQNNTSLGFMDRPRAAQGGSSAATGTTITTPTATNSTQWRISTLHYDISTLLAISHRHSGADVDFVRSTTPLTLRTINNHHSYKSNDRIDNDFKVMFPNSHLW
jgi:hypothetical protein